MSAPAAAVAAANLLLIAALPRFFFRPGRLNLAWWATAAPFAIAGAGICAVAMSLLPVFAISAFMRAAFATTAVLLSTASVALICYTLGTHTRPVSLWHQEHDAPAGLVTHGAYARVRHPFYAAFLLALAACAAAAPSLLTAAALVLGVVQLSRTAKREERRLIAAFGDDYRRYIASTGRFVPKI